jgi:hypothetical protein
MAEDKHMLEESACRANELFLILEALEAAQLESVKVMSHENRAAHS